MLDVRNLVPMESDQAVKLAEASKARADELKAALSVIEARFAGNKRISFDTIVKVLGESIAEYTQGADPAYWTSPAPVAPVVTEDAPEIPGAIESATDAPVEVTTDETPKAGRSRR